MKKMTFSQSRKTNPIQSQSNPIKPNFNPPAPKTNPIKPNFKPPPLVAAKPLAKPNRSDSTILVPHSFIQRRFALFCTVFYCRYSLYLQGLTQFYGLFGPISLPAKFFDSALPCLWQCGKPVNNRNCAFGDLL